MAILRKYPMMASIALWACLVVTSVAGVALYNFDVLAQMGAAGASVLVALIGLPGVILGSIAKILGAKEQ